MTDHFQVQRKEKDLFEKIGPKNSFWAGLMSGVGAFFVIGFFVLLGLHFGGGGGDNGGPAFAGNNPSVNPPTQRPTSGDPTSVSVAKDDWIRGDKNAPISIVEFSDLDCPFCARHHATMLKIIDEYDGKVNWVYRHFPLDQLHPDARKKAEATECAGDIGGQDGFWDYTDAIFERQEGGTDAELAQIAQDVGLNKGKFEKCLSSGKFSDKVDEQSSGAVAAGGTGTPYNVVVSGDNKVPVNGAVPFEQFASIIDNMLN